MLTDNIKELNEQGYTIVDNLIETAFLDAIKESVTAIFDKQIEYTKSKDIIDLFNEGNFFLIKTQQDMIHLGLLPL